MEFTFTILFKTFHGISLHQLVFHLISNLSADKRLDLCLKTIQRSFTLELWQVCRRIFRACYGCVFVMYYRNLQRWCAICQCHFTGDLIEHRRTKKHKVWTNGERAENDSFFYHSADIHMMFSCWWQMAKVSSRPFCTVCERHFRTPRKFVEHMKSPEHKQQVEEVCTLKYPVSK